MLTLIFYLILMVNIADTRSNSGIFVAPIPMEDMRKKEMEICQ